MKKTFALLLLALVISSAAGCKNGLFAKWPRGDKCSQCGPTAPQNVSYSPSYGTCGIDSPYVTAGSVGYGSGIDVAPNFDGGNSSQGVLPTPPGPVGFGN